MVLSLIKVCGAIFSIMLVNSSVTLANTNAQGVYCNVFKETGRANDLKRTPFLRIRTQVNGGQVKKNYEGEKFEVAVSAVGSPEIQDKCLLVVTIEADGHTVRSQSNLDVGYHDNSVELNAPGDLTYFVNCVLEKPNR